MPVRAVAGLLVPARSPWSFQRQEPLGDVQGLPFLLTWSRGASPRLFLRRSRLGLPLNTGYVQSGQNAAPYVLEPGDSSETFQSLPLTLGDR